MRIYVAGKTHDLEKVREVQTFVREFGHNASARTGRGRSPNTAQTTTANRLDPLQVRPTPT